MNGAKPAGSPSSTVRQAGASAVARRGRSRRRLVPIATAVVVLVALAAVVKAVLTPAPATSPAVLGAAGGCTATTTSPAIPSQCAPPFTLTDYKGASVSLARYRGHPVLINFFGVDCTICAEELPDLKAFAARFQRQGGVILGVNTWHETPSYIASYARSKGVDWPLLADEPAVTGARYGVSGTPTNVFVDVHGVIRSVVAGPLTAAQFQQNARLL